MYAYSIKTFVVFKNGEVAALLILINNYFQGIWTHYSSGPSKVKHKWALFQGIWTYYSHHYYLAVEVKLIDASDPIKMKHI